MELTEQVKKQIDDMGYEQMLRLWRNAPVGTPIFQGESGTYYAEAMKKKRAKLGNDEHVRASKSIGW